MLRSKSQGFTLIEMAIVLVIIGLILAAVMKGGDIFHSAQIDRVNKGFFEAWKTVVYEYYDRRGQYLGDGTANGGTGAAQDGQFDGFLGLDQVNKADNLIQVSQAAGIDICSMIESDIMDLTPTGGGIGCGGKNIFERTISSGFSGKHTVAMGFYVCPTEGGVNRNCLAFMNVPQDIAKRLDTHYDGQPDGERGILRVSENLPPVNENDYEELFDPTSSSDDRVTIYNLYLILNF